MEFIARFCTILTRLLFWVLTPVFLLIFRDRRSVPRSTNPLLHMSATELVRKIKNQEVKSVDVIRSYIERIKEVNPMINAVVDDRYNKALKEAALVDEMCKSMPKAKLFENYPLLGVPFSVKEPISVKGLSHTSGMLSKKGTKASKNSPCVDLLKAAGAINLCVTNVPEWSMGWETYNHIYGRTNNPYNLSRTVCGSSGGEASLIGSGSGLIGIGSDMAGSIRIPAMFCGIFGHKPSVDCVNQEGFYPISTDELFKFTHTFGPLARYASDLSTMLEVIAGPKAIHLRLKDAVNVKNLKIYYAEDAGFSLVANPVSEEITAGIRKAVGHFKRLGCSVEKFSIAELQDQYEICSSRLFYMKGRPDFMADPNNPKVRDNLALEVLKGMFWLSKYTYGGFVFLLLLAVRGHIYPCRRKLYAEKERKIREAFTRKLDDNSVFLYPTFHSSAYRHYCIPAHVSGLAFSTIFNVIGFPATNIPIGLDKNKLPIGFQIVAAPYQDRLCLAVAREMETLFGGWKPAP